MQTTLSGWKPANASVRAIWNEIENKIGQNVWAHNIYSYQKYILQLYFTSAAKFLFFAGGFSAELAALNVLDRQLRDGLWDCGTLGLARSAACLKSPKLAQAIKLINWSRSLSIAGHGYLDFVGSPPGSDSYRVSSLSNFTSFHFYIYIKS